MEGFRPGRAIARYAPLIVPEGVTSSPVPVVEEGAIEPLLDQLIFAPSVPHCAGGRGLHMWRAIVPYPNQQTNHTRGAPMPENLETTTWWVIQALGGEYVVSASGRLLKLPSCVPMLFTSKETAKEWIKLSGMRTPLIPTEIGAHKAIPCELLDAIATVKEAWSQDFNCQSHNLGDRTLRFLELISILDNHLCHLFEVAEKMEGE